MKTVVVWILISLQGGTADPLKFPTQSDCQRYAHEVYWQQTQYWQRSGHNPNTEPVEGRCVKTNIVLQSDDAFRH